MTFGSDVQGRSDVYLTIISISLRRSTRIEGRIHYALFVLYFQFKLILPCNEIAL
jgi:hypothetical protein